MYFGVFRLGRFVLSAAERSRSGRETTGRPRRSRWTIGEHDTEEHAEPERLIVVSLIAVENKRKNLIGEGFEDVHQDH